jgi:hypothetical protein
MDVLVVGEPMVLDETGKPAALVLRDVPVWIIRWLPFSVQYRPDLVRVGRDDAVGVAVVLGEELVTGFALIAPDGHCVGGEGQVQLDGDGLGVPGWLRRSRAHDWSPASQCPVGLLMVTETAVIPLADQGQADSKLSSHAHAL